MKLSKLAAIAGLTSLALGGHSYQPKSFSRGWVPYPPRPKGYPVTSSTRKRKHRKCSKRGAK